MSWGGPRGRGCPGGSCCGGELAAASPWGVTDRDSPPTRKGPGWRVAGDSPTMKPPRKIDRRRRRQPEPRRSAATACRGGGSSSTSRPATKASPRKTNSEARCEVSVPACGQAQAAGSAGRSSATTEKARQSGLVSDRRHVRQRPNGMIASSGMTEATPRMRATVVLVWPARLEERLRPRLAGDQVADGFDRFAEDPPSSVVVTSPATNDEPGRGAEQQEERRQRRPVEPRSDPCRRPRVAGSLRPGPLRGTKCDQQRPEREEAEDGVGGRCGGSIDQGRGQDRHRATRPRRSTAAWPRSGRSSAGRRGAGPPRSQSASDS